MVAYIAANRKPVSRQHHRKKSGKIRWFRPAPQPDSAATSPSPKRQAAIVSADIVNANLPTRYTSLNNTEHTITKSTHGASDGTAFCRFYPHDTYLESMSKKNSTGKPYSSTAADMVVSIRLPSNSLFLSFPSKSISPKGTSK